MVELSERIETEAKRCDFSGVVSIRIGPASTYHKAFGYRDVKNKLRNNIGTKFGIASGTKLFTALGIGVLIDQGRLSLKTTMSEVDRSFHTFIDKQATILQLLTHTSGIYDYYDEEIVTDFENFSVEIPWSRLETPSDYLPLFEGRPMKYSPGTRYSYSNGGFVFLGIIIERVSGMLYRDFMAENVFLPAKMEDSGFYPFNDLPANTANGYLNDGETTNIYNLPIRGGADGGMYTTSLDLESFWNRLLASQILSPALTNTYLKTHCKLNANSGYGCGIYKKLDDSAFYIVGSDAGIGFFSQYCANDGAIVSVLSNRTAGDEPLVQSILATIRKNP